MPHFYHVLSLCRTAFDFQSGVAWADTVSLQLDCASNARGQGGRGSWLPNYVAGQYSSGLGVAGPQQLGGEEGHTSHENECGGGEL